MHLKRYTKKNILKKKKLSNSNFYLFYNSYHNIKTPTKNIAAHE